MAELSPIYRPSIGDNLSCLRQGEIVSNVVHWRVVTESIGIGSEPRFEPVLHPYAILMTQDCDLAQDFSTRLKLQESDKTLPCLLFCEVLPAEELLPRIATNKREWERLKVASNKNERFQFLQSIAKELDLRQEGIPELGIDFKRYFAVPTAEVYRRIEKGEVQRRCLLNSPYLEHLSSRFGYFMSRVALESDHESD